MNSPRARTRAVVSGVVQGVGFRIATERRARTLAVSGWVRNLADGRVECVAEGRPEAVDGLLAFLAIGPPGAIVDGVDSRPESAEGLSGFEIRPDGETA